MIKANEKPTHMDHAAEIAAGIITEAIANIDNIASEEDSKFQIINRLLVEALGWPHGAVNMEQHHENGYSDYLVSKNNKNCLLIEAKRIGRLQVKTARSGAMGVFKLNGPALRDCTDGIGQAASYASPNGLPVAILTDGVIWIIFKPHVAGEHYLSKEAFVFPSLQAVNFDFAKFYELLSSESFSNRTFNMHFDELHNPRTLLTRPLVAPIPEVAIIREKKSDFAFDLDKIFDAFFGRMRGEHDEDLLIECFVETRESRIADFTLEKITSNVLGNINPQNRDVDQQLSRLIGETVEQEGGETVFIIGPTGSGKTTFLDRFFRKTLSVEMREMVLPLRLNCLDATGSLDTVILWLTNELIAAIETNNFKNGHPSWEELRGLYFNEYRRKSTGVDAILYKNNKEAFQEKFSAFMEEQVEKDREGYLRRLLFDLVQNRKKLPVVIIDNTDEFSLAFKEAIFQFTQALRRHVKYCIAVFPVTDKSAWAFSKTELFNIYRSRSFFLPTPPPREVFRKRIDYLRRKLRTEPGEVNAQRYFSKRGIRVSIPNLVQFAEVVEQQFVNDERVARVLGELSNYNIRITLDLARRVMTSSVYGIEDVIAVYVADDNKRIIHRKKFMNALLKGDYNFYRAGDAPEIVNLFQVDERVRQSPLVHVRILALLDSAYNASRDIKGKHMEVISIRNYFSVLGATDLSVDTSLNFLRQSRLVEAFDPSGNVAGDDGLLAITHAGRAHLKLAFSDYVYFEQMSLTSHISDEGIASEIGDVFSSQQRLDKKFATVRSLFADFLVTADGRELTIPKEGEQFHSQRFVLEEIRGFQTAVKGVHLDLENSNDVMESELLPPLNGIVATVDWYSSAKGFGFADCAEVDGQVFIHADILERSSVKDLRDGDDILCDIEYGDRGPFVSRIADIQTASVQLATKACRIVRLFPDRGYGFVRPIEATSDKDDVFFHYSLLDADQVERIEEGDEVLAEIRLTSGEKGAQVRSFADC